MIETIEQAREALERHGQGHVVKCWETLDAAGRAGLLRQVEGLDFPAIARMREMLDPRRTGDAPDAGLEPAPVVDPATMDTAAARAEGESALRRGQIGVILVAGGQGSRLGFEGPKGAYSIGPVSGASLFEIHARKILGLERKFGTRIPFYIMTSEANDGPTREFFSGHAFFGLDPDRVLFFAQGMWPALREDGRLVMERPDHLFMSPDGHGGTLTALRDSGMLDDMTRRGLEALFYFQVDNPLVEIADPVFVGLHRLHRSDISVKVCAKRDPGEGLGVVALRGGLPTVVEYSDLPEDLKNARNPGGSLRFLYGSVAIHVFSLPFLKKEANRALPLHIAHKKVPTCDDAGRPVTPDRPNAYKFEKFIFDVLPDATRTLNVVFARENEFSPVKNTAGEDSPATCRRDMIRKAAAWLIACGVEVPLDEGGMPRHKIEIDHAVAVRPEDLRASLPPGFKVDRDVLISCQTM
jgi:UDP-N-acetylglucosamine/UDP-N-acetylgalactosamine diphosphorylase